MRFRAETLLIAAMAVFAFTGWAAMVLQRDAPPHLDPALVEPPAPGPSVLVEPGPLDAAAWFRDVRRYCNPVDVATRLRWQPAPDTDEGRMYQAACYALAGRIREARSTIESLPPEGRSAAAGVVFAAGHPAADAGDDLAAGPLMELVVEYQPDHYMALYHAGAYAFEVGDGDRARDYLTRFLQEYAVDDGWRANAVSMLEAMGG